MDNITGGDGDDTISAPTVANDNGGATVNNATLTALDSIDGGAGSDTLSIKVVGAYTTPTGVTVKNVETVDITASTTVTVNTTAWTGATSLTTSGVGASTITAAATTDITATAATHAGDAVSVNGGKDVSVTTTGATNGTVTVGATTTAAGTSTVSLTQAAMADTTGATTQTGGAIKVTGGTAIEISSLNLGSSGGSDHANDAVTSGAITATGDATTTSISVTQTAAAARVADAAGVTGTAAIANGTVTIADNTGAATALDTLATVTLNHFGASSIDSSALTTLNITGGATAALASGAITIDTQSTATGAATALTINSAGGHLGKIDGSQMDDYTSITVNSSAATTIAEIQAELNKTMDFTGSGDTTITTMTTGENGALKDINVTGTGGVSIGSVLGTTTDFDGNAGKDSISVAASHTTAITMGAGDDTVTYGGALSTATGKVGSVAAGDGEDTIVMSSTEAAAADGTAAFNTAFTGFEVLKIEDALANGDTIDVNGLNAVSKVILAAGGVNATGSIIDKIASGGTVETQATGTAGFAVNVANAALNSADVLNLTLTNSTAAADDFKTATIANVETINITTNDTGTSTSAAATLDVLDLDATAAKTITVTGNNGLNIDLTGNTAVTSFDASGVAADSATTTDTAANLAVKATSANSTATATVTMKGGAGNDVLTGNAAKDTIIGNAGDDTIDGKAGQDTLTGGAGADTFTFASGQTNSTAHDVVTDYTAAASKGDKLDMNGAVDIAEDETASAGSAVGVTITVKDGILTLGGTGASAIDTLAEWIVEANATVDTNDESVAFEFGGDTYVYQQGGSGDLLVELDGVTGMTAMSATAAANTILIA
jgi:S-layer protein